jgi:hypothetical protein
MMKRYLILFQLCSCLLAKGQFVVGTEGLHVKATTDLSVDGLTLRPSSDLTLANNQLSRLTMSLPGSPPSINRLYVFDQAFSFAGRLGLHYESSELNGNNEAGLQVAFKNTSTTVTAGSTLNMASHYIYNDISNNQIKTITAAQSGALPVVLVSFAAKREGDIARLSWSTSYEYQSDYFEIERSMDAKKWFSIGRVDAANTSFLTRSYVFEDHFPLDGANMYRLRMVDSDGSFAHSRVEILHFQGQSRVDVYPNPVVEQLTLRVGNWAEASGYKLINAGSQILAENTLSSQAQLIDMRSYSSGVYFVRIDYKNGSKELFKVIKK